MTFRFHRRLVLWNVIVLLLVVFIAGSSVARSLVALAAGILLTLLIRYILKVRVASPLSELFSAIQKISDGDLTQRVPVKGDADVAELLRATNKMARHLQDEANQLQQGRRKAESFVDAMTEGVMLLDSAGRITVANRAFSRMIANDRDLSGRTTLDIFRNPELEASIQRVLAGDGPRVVGIAHSNGRFAEAHIAGIPNLSGVVDSAVVVFHDLTEVRKTERMRRDFVANVSHEFKTPLTAIRGYTE